MSTWLYKQIDLFFCLWTNTNSSFLLIHNKQTVLLDSSYNMTAQKQNVFDFYDSCHFVQLLCFVSQLLLHFSGVCLPCRDLNHHLSFFWDVGILRFYFTWRRLLQKSSWINLDIWFPVSTSDEVSWDTTQDTRTLIWRLKATQIKFIVR